MRRILVLLALAIIAYGQPKIHQSEWTKPFPPHRIVGPVYYVGTADLACFLITSPKGHILINTGLVDSTAQIRKNIEASSASSRPTSRSCSRIKRISIMLQQWPRSRSRPAPG